MNSSFGDCLGVHSRKRDKADRTSWEARETQNFRGSWRLLLQGKKFKLAHSGGSPGNLFVRKDKTTDMGAYPKKRDGAYNGISEECTTPSFEDGREVLSMNKNLKLPQTGGSPGVFFARHDKKNCHGGFQTRKTVEDKSISEAVATTSFGTVRGVLSINKNLKLPQTGGIPGNSFSPDKTKTVVMGGFKREQQW